MRLIDVKTYAIHEFFGDNIPRYAILSHTWGEGEVTFQDLQSSDPNDQKKQGFQKIKYACAQAQREQLAWAWVDTCCIDKTSSAELTEAINSMYAWYGNSAKCYAYLTDVPSGDDPFSEHSVFKYSRWFTRGWTLQELLAPEKVDFYDEQWGFIGSKTSSGSEHDRGDEQKPRKNLRELLEQVTGIPEACLAGAKHPSLYSVAQRMFWASGRQCTRLEDIAYSLLGIFDVNMPLLYGEGTKAFIRLQEEIMRDIDDHSLFAWTIPERHHRAWIVSGIFAQSPDGFARSQHIVPVHEELGDLSVVTRKGLQMHLVLRPADFTKASGLERKRATRDSFYAVLNCTMGWKSRRIAMRLVRDVAEGTNTLSRSFYRCATAEHLIVEGDDKLSDPEEFRTVFIRKQIPQEITLAFSSLASSKQAHVQGQSNSDSLMRVSNLASVLQGFGWLEEAESLHRQALEGREQVLGKEHPDTLASISNLAAVRQDLGRLKEAESLHRQALEGREQVLGKEHPDTLASISNLAAVRQDLGRLKEAESLHRQALDGRKKVLGKEHPDTLASISNLATVRQYLGRLNAAESLHRQSLDGREKVLGKEHPDTLASISNLATVRQDLGRLKEAESLHRQSGSSDPESLSR